MATIKKTRYQDAAPFGGVPYGNHATIPFQLITTAAGAAQDSDTTAAIGNGDKVVLGVLPGGMKLNDSSIIVSTAFTASVVMALGFEYDDGVDSADVPQNASFFGSGITVNTAGRYRNNTSNPPVTLPKAARLIATFSGAANAKAAQMDVLIGTEVIG